MLELFSKKVSIYWLGVKLIRMILLKVTFYFCAYNLVLTAPFITTPLHLAKSVNPQNSYWNTPPPSYSAATTPGAYMPAPPSYYNTPNSYYGWMPPAYNFPAPDQGTVYVAEAPPPYPGIGSPTGTPGGAPPMGFGGAPGGTPQMGFGGAPGGAPQMGFGGAPPGGAPQTGFGGPAPGSALGGGFANPSYGQQAAFNPYVDNMNGFAHANGNQAYVPMEEKPPTYDAASKKTQ